mmetsp:Transcript_14917/g.30892  ORF Transcript_14917/g.30892 Transcript_14917/m.30892 type:complete len:102 (+) Transcript_14917:420-725(+)
MSSISLVSTTISGSVFDGDDDNAPEGDVVDIAFARNPTMRDRGKGQGWLATNRTDPGSITTPLSSKVSRWQHSSRVSPTSQNPASVEYLPGGHDRFRPKRT